MDTFKFSGKIVCGADSLSSLVSLIDSRVMIVTDKAMVELGHLDEIKKIISSKGLDFKVFDAVLPDPSTEIVTQGIKMFEECCPKIIVAIGGGSVIDCAKGIMYFKAQLDGALWKRPLFIAIPTTSGTGSECTSFSVITTEHGKICIVEDWLVPDYAILNENFTIGIPEKVTYDTGLDVLTHALEASVSSNATPFTDAYAFKAAMLVFDNLPRLKRNLKDMNCRKNMHIASCLAGIAFSQAGLGLNHSLAHALGGTFHIPHGRANTVFLETIFDFNISKGDLNSSYTAKKYWDLAKSINLPARTIREGVMNLRKAISNLKNELGVPTNIKELGIDELEFKNNISILAEHALNDRCTSTAPIIPSIEDIERLYKEAYCRKY